MAWTMTAELPELPASVDITYTGADAFISAISSTGSLTICRNQTLEHQVARAAFVSQQPPSRLIAEIDGTSSDLDIDAKNDFNLAPRAKDAQQICLISDGIPSQMAITLLDG